jgi:putative alpha-1,2-mannosidase
VSRAVEYSTNDFALHQVAAGLSKTAEASTYLNRSRNWRNHWNPAATSSNHSGFVVPRLANGSLVPQDPANCGGCYWGDAYYEDSSWIYSMNAVHDVAELKKRVGGDARFVDRLNKIFELGFFNAGNFVEGEQWRSVNRSRAIGRLYNAGEKGLPGNSDAGAMESNLLVRITTTHHGVEGLTIETVADDRPLPLNWPDHLPYPGSVVRVYDYQLVQWQDG